MRKSLYFLFVMMFVIVSGCGTNQASPVDINPETDKCDVCHMMIHDQRFAAEIIKDDGTAYKYDDIGCLIKHMEEQPELADNTKFIYDYNETGWVNMDEGHYVYNPDVMSPMGYNVFTFSSGGDAQAFVDDNGGTLMTAEELDNHTWERHMTEEMKKKMKEKMNK
ncbi:MAG: nitrous oxide reductase accessory protein NosL [Bacillaceae bacterium]|nr:nitrous oxide reductase accessory protein NosL [Bacillaceae bacterium]